LQTGQLDHHRLLREYQDLLNLYPRHKFKYGRYPKKMNALFAVMNFRPGDLTVMKTLVSNTWIHASNATPLPPWQILLLQQVLHLLQALEPTALQPSYMHRLLPLPFALTRELPVHRLYRVE